MTRNGAARRYAEAAFQLAERDGKVDAWRRDLALGAGLARDERVARDIDNPAVPFAARRKAVEQLLRPPVSREARNLALLLAQRGRFSILPDVSAEYDALVLESRGIVAATVTTPAPLTKKELAGVTTRVEQLAAASVELTTATDPALVGGMTVRIGDRLIDDSLQGRLARLRGWLIQGTS